MLHAVGARDYLKTKKPRLSDDHKAARLEWCRKHADWGVADFELVWFSDETNVYRCRPKGRVHVWDFPARGFTHRRMKRTVKFGGGSAPIWAVISNQGFVVWDFYEGRLTADEYIHLLKERLEPAIEKYWPEGGEGLLTFMHDNAPAHTAAITFDYLDELESVFNLNILPWTSNSPPQSHRKRLVSSQRVLVELSYPEQYRQSYGLVAYRNPQIQRFPPEAFHQTLCQHARKSKKGDCSRWRRD